MTKLEQETNNNTDTVVTTSEPINCKADWGALPLDIIICIAQRISSRQKVVRLLRLVNQHWCQAVSVAYFCSIENLYISSRHFDSNRTMCRVLSKISQKLQRLRSLSLFVGWNDTDVGFLTSLTKLTKLDLKHTLIDDDGVYNISNLTNLKELSLGCTKVSDVAMRNLCGLSNLTKLDLSATMVQDAGVQGLSNLTNLTLLDLRQTRVGDLCEEYLSGIDSLTVLR